MLKCLIPAPAPASRDAVQASGDAQVPGVRQVRVRRRGDAGGRPEVAQGELSLVSCNSTRLWLVQGCFKCSMCNKMLDSTNNNAKDNALYCKVGTV